jgi:hypothetical protein
MTLWRDGFQRLLWWIDGTFGSALVFSLILAAAGVILIFG